MLTSLTPQVLQVTVLIQIYPVIESLPLKSKFLSKLKVEGQTTSKLRLGCKAICGEDTFYDEYYGCEPANKQSNKETQPKKKTVTSVDILSDEFDLKKNKKVTRPKKLKDTYANNKDILSDEFHLKKNKKVTRPKKLKDTYATSEYILSDEFDFKKNKKVTRPKKLKDTYATNEDILSDEFDFNEDNKMKLVKEIQNPLGNTVVTPDEYGTLSTAIQWLNKAPEIQKLPDEFKFCNNLSQCRFYTSTLRGNTTTSTTTTPEN